MPKNYLSIRRNPNGIYKYVIKYVGEDNKVHTATPQKICFFEPILVDGNPTFENTQLIPNSFKDTNIKEFPLPEPLPSFTSVHDIGKYPLSYRSSTEDLCVSTKALNISGPEYIIIPPTVESGNNGYAYGRPYYNFNKGFGVYAKYTVEDMGIEFTVDTRYPEKAEFDDASARYETVLRYLYRKIIGIDTSDDAQNIIEEFKRTVKNYIEAQNNLVNYTLEDFYKEAGINIESSK